VIRHEFLGLLQVPTACPRRANGGLAVLDTLPEKFLRRPNFHSNYEIPQPPTSVYIPTLVSTAPQGGLVLGRS